MFNKPFIAILADLHFGVNNFKDTTFESQMEFFEKQFFPYLKTNNIKYVFCCGDFFHSREKIFWIMLNELKRRFFQWFDDNDVELHMIVGNHDLQYRNTLEQDSLTETTKSFKNVIIYNKESIKNIGKYTVGFVPWIIDTKTYKFPTNCDFLITHLELKDFPMMKGINSKSGYNYKDFKKYKYVFSGHYHTNHIVDNVHMIGTPYQLTWNDFNTNKGFYVLDEEFKYKIIENTTNPKFVKIFYENGTITVDGLNGVEVITKEQSLEIAKYNNCRLYVKKADEQLELDTYHLSLMSVSHNDYKIEQINLRDIIEDFDSESFDEKFNENESTIDIVIACIDAMTFDEGIDKEKIVKATKYFYKKAYDEMVAGEE